MILMLFNLTVLHSYYHKKYFLNPLYAIDWESVVTDINTRLEPGDIVISDEAEVVRYYAQHDLPNASFFYDDLDLKKFVLSDFPKKEIQHFFLIVTERDSTSAPEFERFFLNFLMKKGVVSLRKDYTPVSKMYYTVKQRLTGHAYGHKLHLFYLKIPLKDLIDYFEQQ